VENVIEQAGANYSAYVSDLPGCISVGDMIVETERNIRDVIALYLEGVREGGATVPPSTTRVEYVDVA
jgi:predicted RNase H-like HicB family nuclease